MSEQTAPKTAPVDAAAVLAATRIFRERWLRLLGALTRDDDN